MSDENKVDHILGTIATDIELSDGMKITVKPATMGQRRHIISLFEAVGGFINSLNKGRRTAERRETEALRRELQASLGHAEADAMNAPPASAEMSEAMARRDLLEARLKALDAAAAPGLADGFRRLVSQDAAAFLMENADKLVGPIRALAGYQGTDEEFEALPVADAALMLAAVLMVNVDFFARRLKPIADALAGLKNAQFLGKAAGMAAVKTPSPTGNS